MSAKSTKEFRNLSVPELDEKIHALKQKLIEARLLAASGRLEKPSVISNARKDIARILTLKKEAKKGKK